MELCYTSIRHSCVGVVLRHALLVWERKAKVVIGNCVALKQVPEKIVWIQIVGPRR